MNLSVCILAAGQGKRMRSALPKVLHDLGGKPLVAHVLDTAAELTDAVPVVVHGHGGDRLRAAFADRDIAWVEQGEQLGTGHAVEQALPRLASDGVTLILYGDVPLLRRETLEALVAAAEPSGFALLTARLADPSGYGRIIRDAEGLITRIVEHKEASEDELRIDEINTGIMALASGFLHEWLPAIENDNAQGEFYLTDCVEMATARGIAIAAVEAPDEFDVMGVNNRRQLAELERHLQRRIAARLMDDGVTLRDPSRLDVRGSLTCGADVLIDVNVVIEGVVRIGDRVRIGANCVISDSDIDDDAEILANCVIDNAKVGAQARVGPFARLRPEANLAANVQVGNFVEIKKSDIGPGSKVNHLAYIGDSEIGKDVNVGAGTITCNYDGADKHKTTIEDDVFIGSDTQLVAPVVIGRGATIGAGTTVTGNVDPDTLVLSRVKQKAISGWVRPRKKQKK